MVCLRDIEGYVEDQIVLSPLAFFVATMLDGLNDVTDIQYRFATEHQGQILTSEQINSVVTYLDENGFLYSEPYERIRESVHRTFTESATRSAYMAGKSYPDTPEALKVLLNGYLANVPSDSSAPNTQAPSLLIVPHIDFDRGGAAYAQGYACLRNVTPPKTVIIFGVAHAGGEAPFILLKKGFETPLGTLEVDADLCDTLTAACPEQDATQREADLFLHRNEHSIEFQAVWLTHLFGTNTRIVPILCGQMFMMDDASHAITLRPGAETFLNVCRDAIAGAPNGDMMVIAGADLAHVGQHFGDPFEITQPVLESIEARDREDLVPILAGDAETFLHSVMRDGNVRRVCGLGCIYAAIRSVVPKTPGQLLHYGHAPDPQGGIVSFASVVIQN